MKWALFKGFASSMGVACGWVCVGRNLVILEKMDAWACGGRFRIDFPATGIVTADDDGEHDDVDEDDDAAMVIGWLWSRRSKLILAS
jgi:hypothetical protein